MFTCLSIMRTNKIINQSKLIYIYNIIKKYKHTDDEEYSNMLNIYSIRHANNFYENIYKNNVEYIPISNNHSEYVNTRTKIKVDIFDKEEDEYYNKYINIMFIKSS